ncbi:unnamed protein product [Brachionus calyciflorus]|uniref:C-type lectin domain-containing protein n=1 Tax=Brachionus calyciflorus TaxID=104777 RepID=A0A813SXS4_9BILA|nr:unnamed protein product [Brachionus calyciflorus]
MTSLTLFIFSWISSNIILVDGHELNMFRLLKRNGLSGLSVSNSFQLNYSLSFFENETLIHCASKCSKNEKCSFFSHLTSKIYKKCELFFGYKLDTNELNFIKNSKVYEKRKDTIIATATSTLFTSTMKTSTILPFTTSPALTSTTTTPDFVCSGSDCTCIDSSNFYSTTQKKCIKCRNGWFPYKNICYQGFTTLRSWSNSIAYCNSLNSTLLLAENEDKFIFFQSVSRNLSTISSNLRTWVFAEYTTLNVFQWMNGKTINSAFIMSSAITTITPCCFAYMSAVNSLLGIYTCTLTSNLICEYTE